MRITGHPFEGELRSGASCQHHYPDNTVCARQAMEHTAVPDPSPEAPAARCSHGGDCTVHPDAEGLHDFTPTAQEALDYVLSAVQMRYQFSVSDVRDIAARLGVTLTRDRAPDTTTPPGEAAAARLDAAYRLVYADLTRRADDAHNRVAGGHTRDRKYVHSLEMARALVAREGGLEENG